MAVLAFTDGFFSLNGVDLSARVKSVTLNLQAAELDATSITDDYDVTVIGRRSGELAIEFMDDFAASQVDVTVATAFNGTLNVPFSIRPLSSAVSATNPEYKGSVVPSTNSFGGAQGELLMKSLTFKTSGTVMRGTS
jgi:hypothetical protein